MWKAQKARFPHSHNHYCYCRFFSFLKHNFPSTPTLSGNREIPRLSAGESTADRVGKSKDTRR